MFPDRLAAGLKILALPTVVRIHLREFFCINLKAGIFPAFKLVEDVRKDLNHQVRRALKWFGGSELRAEEFVCLAPA